MEQATDTPLKKTPLNARHRASGAKMVPFGGWDMPVEYSRHHRTSTWRCATRAGLFDVSHMGEIEIAGKDALAAVQRISCNDASKLQVGQAQYSGLLTPAGHVRRRPARLPPRPPRTSCWSSTPRNIAEGLRLDRRAHQAGVGDAVAVDASSRYALIAVQGPEALERPAAADRRRPRRR